MSGVALCAHPLPLALSVSKAVVGLLVFQSSTPVLCVCRVIPTVAVLLLL